MTSNITNVLMAADGIKPLGDRLVDGLQVFVIGISAVFLVLAVLWGVLVLFKLAFYDIPQKRKAALKEKATKEILASSKKDAPAVDASVEPAALTPAEDDTQLIAVITAAIAAYSAQSGNALPFRVVSYKRVRGAGGWNGAENNETF